MTPKPKGPINVVQVCPIPQLRPGRNQLDLMEGARVLKVDTDPTNGAPYMTIVGNPEATSFTPIVLHVIPMGMPFPEEIAKLRHVGTIVGVAEMPVEEGAKDEEGNPATPGTMLHETVVFLEESSLIAPPPSGGLFIPGR